MRPIGKPDITGAFVYQCFTIKHLTPASPPPFPKGYDTSMEHCGFVDRFIYKIMFVQSTAIEFRWQTWAWEHKTICRSFAGSVLDSC